MKGLALTTAFLLSMIARADVFSRSWANQMESWRKLPAREMAAKYDFLIRTKGERPEWLAGYAANVGSWQGEEGNPKERPPHSSKDLALARARRAAALAPKRAYPLLSELRVWVGYSSPDFGDLGNEPYHWETMRVRQPGGQEEERRIKVFDSKAVRGPIDPWSRGKVLDLLKKAKDLEPNDGEVLALRAQFAEKSARNRLRLLTRAAEVQPAFLFSFSFLEGIVHAADAIGDIQAAATWRRQIQAAVRAHPDEYATKRFLERTGGKV